MADQTVTLRIIASAGQAAGEIRTTKEAVKGLGEEGRKASTGVRQLSASQDAAGNAASRMSAAMSAARAAGITALAVAAARSSDMMASLAARIGLVSDSTRDAAAAQSEVVRIAQQTGAGIEATGRLYVRLASALKDTGASQREVAGLTETVNKAMMVSGATSAEASGAITQLSQAFASGVLRGDEFNSVNEAAPRLMDALAKSLNVTRGELRKLAEDGKLTAGAMRAALSGDQAKAIAAEFSKLPATIGRAWQQLINSSAMALAKLTQDSGAYSLASAVLSGMARALDFITPKVVAFGSLLGGALRDGYNAAVDLAQTIGNSLLGAFADLTDGSKEAAGALRDDMLDGLGELARNAANELQILPVTLRTIMTIGIGEFDKLRIGAIEKFQLLVVAGQQAWLSLRAATSSLANDMRLLVGSALDGIISAYANLVGGIGNLAGKLGLESLQGRLAATSQSLLAMADGEAKAKAAADETVSTYAAERAALEQRSAAISDTATLQRAAADSAIQASLDERQAALDGLAVKTQELELSDRIGKDRTKNAAAAKDAAKAMKEAAKAVSDRLSAERALADFLGRLQSKTSEEAKAQFEYETGLRELQDAAEAAAIAGADVEEVIRSWQAAEQLLQQEFIDTNSAIAERADVMGRLAEDTAYERSLIGMTRREREFAEAHKRAMDEFRQNKSAMAVAGISANQYADAVANAAQATFDLAAANDIVVQLQEQDSPYHAQLEQIETLQKAIERVGDANSDAFDADKLKAYEAAQARISRQVAGMKLEAAANNIAAGLTSLQRLAKEGSQAYLQMQVAIDAANIAAAIGAIMNQGMGDPYTAFARMAAMAALVASFVGNVGASIDAGFSDSAGQRQAAQGTGTVLGDSAAKSESIAKAINITAKATTALVGLNRGMLNALQALQNALGAAGNQLARGAANGDFGGISNGFNIDLFGGDPLTGAISSFLFGGTKKITDQGIVIVGGTLTDMINSVMVGAYQTVETDGGLFESNSSKDRLLDVSGAFAKQFQLVISSLVDTVREGALALGLLPADVEAALASFRVEEIRISLKGLSAEEQQAEIEAVFSSIFDNLAGSVVPWIGQFQQVGEGLGETLVRIATEVAVAQEAFKQLGLAVNVTDPERFAQISDALIQAAGGLDAFISGMQSFVSNFAPESHQFDVASDALTSALAQVGLSLPGTREEMWALMQSFDATTESGREQIATLLRLADVADQYYSALDRQVSEATKLLDGMGLLTDGLSDFGRAIVDIKAKELGAIDAANTLAKARGMEGAGAAQLAAIHTWTAQQIAAAIRKLQTETRDLIAKLYGGVPGSLDAINERIAELERSTGGISSGIDTVREAGENLFESWLRGVQSIQDYLDSMLLGDLSALTPEEQIAEAQRQLLDAQAAAMRGDVDALNKLPQLADAFLRLQRDNLASGGDYNAQFEWVRQLLGSVAGMQNPYTAPGDQTGGGGGVTVGPSPELEALYAARDAALAEQYVEQRRALAEQLTQHLADLATALNVPIFDLIEAQGVNLRELATDLGVDLQNLTASSVEVLGAMATTLGVSMTALTSELGLELTDLGAGIKELTQRVGIDLSSLTIESTQSLAALAQSLGMNLAELSTAVGIDLGKLTDKQSLLNQSLAATIDTLPDGTRDQLKPLLEAITSATTEADANAAIGTLEEAVKGLSPDLRNELAPYLENVLPARALTQLDYLGDIQRIARYQLDVLGRIADNLKASNVAAGVPSYAVGTGFVPHDQLANIHYGEAVVPAHVNAWFQRANWQLPRTSGGGSDERVVIELRSIRERLESLERSNVAGHSKTADSVAAGDAKARIQRDEIARKQTDLSRSRAS